MPKGSDSTFAAKLRQHHSGHPRFGQAAGAAARAAPGDDFTVQHYAGPVTYSAAKFLDKNRDTLSKGVADGGRVGGWPALLTQQQRAIGSRQILLVG